MLHREHNSIRTHTRAGEVCTAAGQPSRQGQHTRLVSTHTHMLVCVTLRVLYDWEYRFATLRAHGGQVQHSLGLANGV